MNHAASTMVDRQERPPRFFTWEKLVVWLVAGLLAYAAVESRLAVLEVRYERLAEDIAEIKGDVKSLIRIGGVEVRP